MIAKRLQLHKQKLTIVSYGTIVVIKESMYLLQDIVVSRRNRLEWER